MPGGSCIQIPSNHEKTYSGGRRAKTRFSNQFIFLDYLVRFRKENVWASWNFRMGFASNFLPSTSPLFLRRQILVEKESFLQEAPYNLLILGRNLEGGNL
jgi:hypothetical protein